MKTSLCKISICTLFLGINTLVSAQTDWKLYPGKTNTTAYTSTNNGGTEFVVDSRITALSERFAKENKGKSTLNGYRVQIFWGS